MSQDKFTPAPIPDPEAQHGYEILARQSNARGYILTAYRVHDYHGSVQEFVQVDSPGGTCAYFTDPENPRPGPFGGGYSWSVPAYVLKAVTALLRTAFPIEEES